MVSGEFPGQLEKLAATIPVPSYAIDDQTAIKVIDGTVEGLITLDERKLTVGASAKVTADIIAREVVVYGTVKGNLRAKDRIEIKKDGSVNGDLTTSRIMIEDGAYFKGSIEIDKSADKDSAHSAFAKKESPATAGKTI